MNTPQVEIRPDLEKQWELLYARFDEWTHTELFTLQWWLLLATFLATTLIWWIRIDRARLGDIMLYSSIVILFIITLDEIGEELCLWYYPIDLFFLFPPTTAINISCMPLIYMLIYQRFRHWRAFIAANVIMAAVFCFVLEPVAIWVGIYQTLTWKTYYGFLIYALIAVVSKLIVRRVYSIQGNKKRV